MSAVHFESHFFITVTIVTTRHGSKFKLRKRARIALLHLTSLNGIAAFSYRCTSWRAVHAVQARDNHR